MLEIDRDSPVPIVLGDLLGLVALVMGRVVDEDIDRAVRAANSLDAGAQRLDDGHVASLEMHGVSRLLQFTSELRRGRLVDVEEAYLRLLPGEGAHDRLADAAPTARDENAFVFEVGIDRAGGARGHGILAKCHPRRSSWSRLIDRDCSQERAEIPLLSSQG